VDQQGSGDGYDIYHLNRDGGGRVQLTQTPLWVAVALEGESNTVEQCLSDLVAGWYADCLPHRPQWSLGNLVNECRWL